ncbi:MAG: hypothetical protein QM820_01415 [Minicystis sp.]
MHILNKTLVLALTLTSFLFALPACKDETAAGGSGGSGDTGTCESTCSKSIALNCASGEHDQAACVASCQMQQASCAAQADAFQDYLDCIQSTDMVCGDTTQAPSSPDCLAQGLMILGCASGLGQ